MIRRLPVGPTTGNSPGLINGIDGASITDEYVNGLVQFKYGVDYLGYWLATAVANWNKDYPGVTMPGVDVICHSTGGLVTRTYIQTRRLWSFVCR